MMKRYEVDPQSTSFAPGQPTGSSTYNNSAPQTVSANPSLILAFLALSFFTMAMVFIFGFRRYHYLQDRLHEVFGRGGNPNWQAEQQAAEEIRLRRLPGMKPKLWDVCTDANVRWRKVRAGVAGKKVGGESDALWNWHSIMPLSASKVVNANESGIAPNFPASSSSIRSERNNLFRRFWRFRTALPPRSSDKSLGHPKSTMAPSVSSELHVAVLVTMPSERYPVFERGLGKDRLWSERGYELGFYEIPWDDDDGS